MTEEKVTDLEFGLRREFVLNNNGNVIPNVLHFISTITKCKSKKIKMVSSVSLVLLQKLPNYL